MKLYFHYFFLISLSFFSSLNAQIPVSEKGFDFSLLANHWYRSYDEQDQNLHYEACMINTLIQGQQRLFLEESAQFMRLGRLFHFSTKKYCPVKWEPTSQDELHLYYIKVHWDQETKEPPFILKRYKILSLDSCSLSLKRLADTSLHHISGRPNLTEYDPLYFLNKSWPDLPKSEGILFLESLGRRSFDNLASCMAFFELDEGSIDDPLYATEMAHVHQRIRQITQHLIEKGIYLMLVDGIYSYEGYSFKNIDWINPYASKFSLTYVGFYSHSLTRKTTIACDIINDMMRKQLDWLYPGWEEELNGYLYPKKDEESLKGKKRKRKKR